MVTITVYSLVLNSCIVSNILYLFIEASCSNGYSVHKNGTTNGVTNGVQAAAAAVMKAELEVESKHRSVKR